MTDNSFSVNLDELDNVVSRLTGLAGFLHDHLDGIDAKVKALHSGSWDGVAAQAYIDAHTQWAASAREFAQGVTDMSVAGKQAHTEYTDAGNKNVGMLRAR